MPRTDPTPTWNPVSVAELWAKIGGGTPFTIDDIVRQLDAAEAEGKEFRITHNNVNYFVPLDQIRDYFVDHPRPQRKMTREQELAFLRVKVREQEAVLVEHGLVQDSGLAERSTVVLPPSDPTEPSVPDTPRQSTSEITSDLLSDLRKKKPITRSSKVVNEIKQGSHSPSA